MFVGMVCFEGEYGFMPSVSFAKRAHTTMRHAKQSGKNRTGAAG